MRPDFGKNKRYFCILLQNKQFFEKARRRQKTHKKPRVNFSKARILCAEGNMIEHDTIELLRECDAGIQMGISAIDEVKDHAQKADFRTMLDDYQREYAQLQNEIQGILHKYHDEGKDPNPVAKGMAWLKTNVMMAVKETDEEIANLLTDGCNMGIKSLNKYLNDYAAADERAQDITRRLIELQDRQLKELERYL